MASRKRRRIKYLISSFIIFLFIIVVCLGAVLFFCNRINTINGVFVESCDITDMVIANTMNWLSDIDNNEMDYEWIRSKLDSITVDIELNLNKNKFGQGDYIIEVNEESYNNAIKKTYELSTKCMYEIIKNNLIERGYNEDLSDDKIKKYSEDILGCSIEDYLYNNKISIIPDFDDFSLDYTESGSYTVKYSQITFVHNNIEETVDYIYGKNVLMFPSKNIIFRKQVQP